MKYQIITQNSRSALLAGLAAILVGGQLHGATVPLQDATATRSQVSGWNVGTTIDGVIDDSVGWAIHDFSIAQAVPETAVFESIADVGFAGESLLTFQLFQINHNPQHTIGRFRLSVTTDNRDTFADGLANGGDVTANWSILSPLTTLATDGAILTAQGDGSILASGVNPITSVYTVTAFTSLQAITGFRLEVLEDPSLPFDGPGRFPLHGNFVLTEFQVNIVPVPEPSAVALLLCGGLGIVGLKALRKMKEHEKT